MSALRVFNLSKNTTLLLSGFVGGATAAVDVGGATAAVDGGLAAATAAAVDGAVLGRLDVFVFGVLLL